MKSDFCIFVFFLCVLGLTSNARGQHDYRVYYEWKVPEFDFPGGNGGNTREMIQKNWIITSLKIYKDRIYLTTPRYRAGVPVTLSSVPYDRLFSLGRFWDNRVEGPKLEPFPSLEMNEEFNCSALQMVHSMEVDGFNRLWVVDLGRSSILEEEPRNSCPAKLVVFDLGDGTKAEARKKTKPPVLFTYTFPDEVANRTGNILKDIQVACTTLTSCWVYISDLAASRLVVYDMKNNQSWTAEHPLMGPDRNQANIRINEQETNVPFGITGLGLSPRGTNFSTLHFSPLASNKIYRINTTYLQNPDLLNNSRLPDEAVTEFMTKSGQSDGFAMDHQSNLYYGILPSNSVYYTNVREIEGNNDQERTSTLVAENQEEIIWPDTFSFDGKGKLLLISSRFNVWEAGKINASDHNYRVILLTNSDTRIYPYNSFI